MQQIVAARYELQKVIGKGGMGTVYQALDRNTGQTVAVKALKAEVTADSPDMVERFLREGEALRQLNHPNIVKMLDALQENKQHYLVMEHISGGSLKQRLDEPSPLAIEEILSIALGLADALTRAHYLKIIHRDIKPANVLLAEDGTPRLTDFGVARVANSQLTQERILVGTLDYMSPEACNSDVLDQRSDIWSFGVMLFEMLAGERPFGGVQPSAVLTRILLNPVPDLEALRPDAPVGLVDLVYRMLDKDRDARIQSVRQVGAELEALLAGTPLPVKHRLSKAPEDGTLLISERFKTPTPLADAPKHNLPADSTPFIGRQDELAELGRVLSDAEIRLVTILAPGGMGKTRFAIQAATGQLRNFIHGVYFVPLAPLSSADHLLSTVAEAVKFQFYGDGEPRDQLLNYFREKTLLLVMDNFEHILDGATLVADIMQRAPQVKVIVTSRERLNITGETLFAIGGMDFPDWETPEDALEYSAVKLFLQSARRVRPGFELQAEDLNFVARICRLVDGMPLGIVLAAAWIELLSPAEIAQEIEQSLDFLETELRDVPARQQSIRAVFEYSWTRLTADEQNTFKQLSVFRGGFTREAAQAVTGTGLRPLTTLVNKSLARRKPDGRFDMHELLRQYAASFLAKTPTEQENVQRSHALYYLDFLHRAERDWEGPKQLTRLAEIEHDIENIRVAWEWAISQKQVDLIQKGIHSLYNFYFLRGWRLDGEAALSAVVRLFDSPEPAGETGIALGRALCCLSDFTSNARVAREYAERGLDVMQRLGGPERDIAFNLAGIGANIVSGEEGEQMLRQAQAIFERLGDRWGIGLVNFFWARHYSRLVNHSEAVRYLEEALKVFRQVGDRFGEGHALAALGRTSNILGDYAASQRYFEESLITFEALENQAQVANVYNSLSNLALDLNEFVEAEGYVERSLSIHQELGNRSGYMSALDSLGTIKYEANAYAEAKTIFEACMAGFIELDDTWGIAFTHKQLGFVALGMQAFELAHEHFLKALGLAQTIKSASIVLDVLVGLAMWLAHEGQKEKALEMVLFTTAYPGLDRHIKDEAHLLATLTAELPVEVVMAARERAKTLEVESLAAEFSAPE